MTKVRHLLIPHPQPCGRPDPTSSLCILCHWGWREHPASPKWLSRLWTWGMSPPLRDEMRQGMALCCCEKGREDWPWPLAHLLTGPSATCWVGSGLARVTGNRVTGLPSALHVLRVGMVLCLESGGRWDRTSIGSHAD